MAHLSLRQYNLQPTPGLYPSMITPQLSGFCATGHELSNEVKRHNVLVADVQRQMRAIHLAEDSSDRRVPRSLQDTLRSVMEPRTLARFYWDKHRAQCWRCEEAALGSGLAASEVAA